MTSLSLWTAYTAFPPLQSKLSDNGSDVGLVDGLVSLAVSPRIDQLSSLCSDQVLCIVCLFLSSLRQVSFGSLGYEESTGSDVPWSSIGSVLVRLLPMSDDSGMASWPGCVTNSWNLDFLVLVDEEAWRSDRECFESNVLGGGGWECRG
jgi:hypothetical protein